MPRLSGKVAIITGAGSGIGHSALQIFAKEGARVAASDVDLLAVSAAVEGVRAAGGTAVAYDHDVASMDSWEQVVKGVMDDWGTVDILVNNAGILIPKGIIESDVVEWEKVLSVNATGTFLGMKSVLPIMVQAGRGSIVNVSSIAALVGGIGDGGAAGYSASKGAVRSLTKHAAQSYGEFGIRVNSIHPGPVFTALAERVGLTQETMANADLVTLPPHVGEPSDIAYGMVYLASDEAKFVTGAELVIDGGFVSH